MLFHPSVRSPATSSEAILRLLWIVSITYGLMMGCYNDSLSLDTTIMVSKIFPTIGEDVIIIGRSGKPFSSYFSCFLHGHGHILCLRLFYYIDLFRLTVVLFGRQHVLANSNYEKKKSPRAAKSSRFI